MCSGMVMYCSVTNTMSHQNGLEQRPQIVPTTWVLRVSRVTKRNARAPNVDMPICAIVSSMLIFGFQNCCQASSTGYGGLL